MKYVILSFFLTINSYASFYFSPGLNMTSSSPSEEKNSNYKELLSLGSGAGFHLDSELDLVLGFSANMGFQFTYFVSELQYDYTNPDNSSDQATIEDFEVLSMAIGAIPTLRFYLINGDQFKLFIGAGLYKGYLGFTYTEQKFKEENGSTSGYTENTEGILSGNIHEVGIKYFWNNINGLQVTFARLNLESDKIEVLGKKEVSITLDQINILYNVILF